MRVLALADYVLPYEGRTALAKSLQVSFVAPDYDFFYDRNRPVYILGFTILIKNQEVAMGGMIEEILKNKEELIVALFKVLEGKEARARVKLDGVKFNIGKSAVRMEGSIEFTLIPVEERKK